MNFYFESFLSFLLGCIWTDSSGRIAETVWVEKTQYYIDIVGVLISKRIWHFSNAVSFFFTNDFDSSSMESGFRVPYCRG